MEKQISKAEIIFLSFNTTAYTIADALSSNTFSISNYQSMSTALFFIMVIDIAVTQFLCGYLMKATFHQVTIISTILMAIHGMIGIGYDKKIQMVSKSYGSYYPFFMVILFVLIFIGSIVYFFTLA